MTHALVLLLALLIGYPIAYVIATHPSARMRGFLIFCVAALCMPGFAATGLVLYVLRRRAGRRREAAVRSQPLAVAGE